ncbi:methyltransferase domain-containing protein [Niabella yanshanensis]|uniref:Methyltransferase domain-containing protein n=1 Tax=Niabella yanshanensis TaxID=577386 RepID=A0ABZ0W2J6_9BACT|nr:methyltransferase domain-containing protein [Niabella yanshanensis]WQD37336.1 methyltransferase domain-containing protein [Niabella yanshanensis]
MKLKDSIITKISSIKNPQKKPTIALAKLLKNKTGLEIGGPSPIFKQTSYYPAYLYANRVDGVNYNAQTVWEGTIKPGKTYEYLKGYEIGNQFITEATALEGIVNNTYDFILSSHSLEHISNPLKALKRWNEVLKPGGSLCLILPNKEVTFDKDRDYTTFDHLLNDYKIDVSEHDNTHFEEVLQHHIIALDSGVKSKEELIIRTKDNFQNRCIHHHVFSFDLITQALNFAGFRTVLQKKIHDINLFTLAIKP